MDFKKEFLEAFITKYKAFFFEHEESIKERESINNALLSEFMDRYNLQKFKDIGIDDYCFEKGNKDTYTYWLDNTLNDFCNIHIANACGYQKFHLQKINGEYVFKKKNQKTCWAGDDETKVFKTVKQKIIEIIEASQGDGDVQAIKSNRIYQPTKAKISFLYNPGRWIPISVNNDVDAFLKEACIDSSFLKLDFFDKRELIFKFYLLVRKEIESITPWRMMVFIYHDDGYRSILGKKGSGKNNNGSKSNSKKGNGNKKPDIPNVEAEIYVPSPIGESYYENDDVISDERFDQEERNKKIVGKKGEAIVQQYLLNQKSRGFMDICSPCIDGRHNKHHDFSYVFNGKRYYVEVKASAKRLKDGLHFEMSKFEYQFMEKNINNYFIYYVADVFNSPKIYVIKAKEIKGKLTTSKYEMYSS